MKKDDIGDPYFEVGTEQNLPYNEEHKIRELERRVAKLERLVEKLDRENSAHRIIGGSF